MVRGREAQRRPFSAQAPEISRVARVASHADDAAGFGLDQYAAAALGAGRGGFHGRNGVIAVKASQQGCHLLCLITKTY